MSPWRPVKVARSELQVAPSGFPRLPAMVDGRDMRCAVRGCERYASMRRLTRKSMFAIGYCGPHEHQAHAFFGPAD